MQTQLRKSPPEVLATPSSKNRKKPLRLKHAAYVKKIRIKQSYPTSCQITVVITSKNNK